MFVSGVQELPIVLKKITEAGDLPKRGGKRKAKAAVTVAVYFSKKIKKMVKKPKLQHLCLTKIPMREHLVMFKVKM